MNIQQSCEIILKQGDQIKAAYYPTIAEMNQFFTTNPTACVRKISDECVLKYYEPLANWAIEIKDLEVTKDPFSFKEWSTRPYSNKVGLRTNEGRNLGKAEIEIIPPMTRTLCH